MVALSARARLPLAWASLLRVVSAPARLLFCERPGVGLLVLAGLATQPRSLLLGGAALLGATLAARRLQISTAGSYLPYAYNALLVGLALAHGLRADAVSLALSLGLGALSVLVTAALGSVSAILGWLPLSS